MIEALKARPRTRQNDGRGQTETRQGAGVYGGSPTEFFDWEFRTRMKFLASKPDDRPRAASQVVEGLRDGALKVAQGIGVEKLTTQNGIDKLIKRIKKTVFPYLKDEARRMYKLGHEAGQMTCRDNRMNQCANTQTEE